MPESRDPLVCPRCGAPKRADQFECAACLEREHLDEHERCIDDPPANDSGDEHYGAD